MQQDNKEIKRTNASTSCIIHPTVQMFQYHLTRVIYESNRLPKLNITFRKGGYCKYDMLPEEQFKSMERDQRYNEAFQMEYNYDEAHELFDAFFEKKLKRPVQPYPIYRKRLTNRQYLQPELDTKLCRDLYNEFELTLSDKLLRYYVMRTIINYIDDNSQRILLKTNSFDDCTICKVQYQNDELLRKLRCGHVFHRKCVDLCIVQNCICPICDITLTENDITFKGTRVIPKEWDEIINDCSTYMDEIILKSLQVYDQIERVKQFVETSTNLIIQELSALKWIKR